MIKIADRAAAVGESPTLATSAKVKAMKAKGMDIINLTVGEPDFDTPGFIREAAIEAIRANKADHYTPTAGIPELRQAIVDYLKNQDGVEYTSGQIIVTDGAKHALYTLFQVIVNPGDEVLIPAPYWVSYTEQVRLAGGVDVIVPGNEENRFKVTVADLEKARTARTVALIMNIPSNPSGVVYTREEMLAIGEWAVEHDILLVSDEIYNRLTYNGARAYSFPSLSESIKQQTILVSGVSKTYAMTGWRVGYAAGPSPIISKMIEVASHSTSNPAAPSQYAALAALQADQSFVEGMRKELEERLNFFYPLLAEVPGIKVLKSDGAFYLFADMSEAARRTGYANVQEFALALIEEAQVAVVSGEGFGMPDYARFSYTVSKESLQEAVERIKAFIEKKTDKH